MQSRDFCYWLQGFFEVGSMGGGTNTPEVAGLTSAQVSMIRNHLNMVFAHEIDPAMGDAKHQAQLNKIHSSPTNALPGSQILMRC